MTWGLYNFFIRLLVIAVHVHAIFNNKSRLTIRGRNENKEFPSKHSSRIWIHCASLGEFEQARPIIDRLDSMGHEVMLSFFSPSGYEQRKNYPHAKWIGYMPFDTSTKAKDFIETMKPDAVVFVKYEFWWNHISILLERETPTFYISVVLRKEHYLFRSWAAPFLQTLRKVNAIFTIDETSYKLLESQDFQNIHPSSDTRIESVLEVQTDGQIDPLLKKFAGDEKVVIFGSTYPIEHQELLKISDDLIGSYNLMIFPHEIDRKELVDLKAGFGKHCMLYSELKDHPIFTDFSILIVDTIGLLKDAYRLAALAYVGGGFNHGLHNTLEPFVYKIPLIIGPKYERFPEARLLAKQPFVGVLSDIGELKQNIEALMKRDFSDEIEKVHYRIFVEGGHASNKIIEIINASL